MDADKADNWNSRGHFFAAAAEAMRRILVDNARRKQAAKHGGDVAARISTVWRSPFPRSRKTWSRWMKL